jgi:hypothetical protein
MKNQLIRLILMAAAGLMALPGMLPAQPTAHYVPGVEGIKAASLPPPGWYVRDYNLFYGADRLNNTAGDDVGPPNFEVFTYANVPRVIWISKATVLGGSIGVDALLPLIYQDVQAGGFDDSTFGVGDLFVEGTLSWHLKQFDFSAAAGVWMPTGDSEAQPTTEVGEGYWTPMLTAGATWYIDADKTWALSVLNRYEFNTEQTDTDITPGQAYTLEWGASKTLGKIVDVGVVGYLQQQVTTDSGTGASDLRDRVLAVGPEVSVAIPDITTFISLRYNFEVLAEDRAQGGTFTLTLTKRF